MTGLVRRDAIAKAFRIAKRGEALEKRDPWATLVSKTRWREFGDDLEAALAQEGYVIAPAPTENDAVMAGASTREDEGRLEQSGATSDQSATRPAATIMLKWPLPREQPNSVN